MDEGRLGPVPTAALTEAEHAKNNLPDILTRWQKRDGAERQRLRTAQSFCVPKGELAQEGYDLSLNRYKEVLRKELDHRLPSDILRSLAQLEDEIRREIHELEAMLS